MCVLYVCVCVWSTILKVSILFCGCASCCYFSGLLCHNYSWSVEGQGPGSQQGPWLPVVRLMLGCQAVNCVTLTHQMGPTNKSFCLKLLEEFKVFTNGLGCSPLRDMNIECKQCHLVEHEIDIGQDLFKTSARAISHWRRQLFGKYFQRERLNACG